MKFGLEGIDRTEKALREMDLTFRTSPFKNKIKILQKQFSLLKIFMWLSAKLSHVFEDNLLSSIRVIGVVYYLKCTLKDLDHEDNEDSKAEISVKKLLHLNSILKEAFQDLSDLFLQSKCFSIEELKEILDLGTQSLKDLRALRPDMIANWKNCKKIDPNQIGSVEKRLEFISAIFHFASRDQQRIDELKSFFNHIEDCAKIAAVVPFLFWVDETDGVNVAVSQLMEKFKPCTVELAESYLGALMALKPFKPREHDFNAKEIAVARFLEVLLEDLILPSDDDFELLQHGLTFFISLLVNPPLLKCVEKGKVIICVNKVASLICSLYACNLNEKPSLLHDLVENIDQAKSEIREFQIEVPALSSNYNFPSTNVKGFLDFFFEDLVEKLKYETLTKYQRRQVTRIQKLLLCLKPLLMAVFEHQDEMEGLNDLQRKINRMVYRADYVIDSCFLSDPTIYWQNVICLSDVIEEIQFIQTELNQSRYKQISNTRVVGDKMMNSGAVLPAQASNLVMDNVMVGFVDEKERIINYLTGGLTQCDIVAIVGMGGQGKTTLAKNLYYEPLIRLHFKKYAWCCISQEYNIKDILIEILQQVDPKVDISNKSHEDLAAMLYRCLKGKSYLIVLDDVWNIEVWNELKASFPDDENGSRIILTSRIHKVALEAKADCNLLDLSPLSLEDSLELLRQKLSYKDGFPLNLLDLGRKIAEICKGLPLAIGLVAGLLAKANGNFAFWKQIAETLTPQQVAREGCMDILQVSYNKLPDYLKPCFLYLAAFREDKQIPAKMLTQYWIAEGFVRKNEKKCLKDVANEYLIDLVGRSLLFVAHKSSTYGMKKFVVHDLVRELCLEKAREENFLLTPKISNDFSVDTMPQCYRLCFGIGCFPAFDSEAAVSATRTFLCFEYLPTYLPFKLLRILNLVIDGCDIVAITQLIHLRYLVLGGVVLLPPSIVNLSRLEYLDLITTRGTCSLPNTMWNMKSLRHLKLGWSRFIDMDDLVGESQLNHLETFILNEDDFVSEEEFKWMLKRMPNLRKMHFNLKFCLRLSDFLSKIESLTWAAFGRAFAPEFDFPSTLKKLTVTSNVPLSETSMTSVVLSKSVMSAIGRLPNLEVLKIFFIDFEEKTWDVEDEEFLNLKYLKLLYSKIEQWNVSTYCFPQLQQLILKRCDSLLGIPSRFGDLSTLRVMKVSHCRQLYNSVQDIVAEQHELGNMDLKIKFSDGDL